MFGAALKAIGGFAKKAAKKKVESMKEKPGLLSGIQQFKDWRTQQKNGPGSQVQGFGPGSSFKPPSGPGQPPPGQPGPALSGNFERQPWDQTQMQFGGAGASGPGPSVFSPTNWNPTTMMDPRNSPPPAPAIPEPKPSAPRPPGPAGGLSSLPPPRPGGFVPPSLSDRRLKANIKLESDLPFGTGWGG